MVMVSSVPLMVVVVMMVMVVVVVVLVIGDGDTYATLSLGARGQLRCTSSLRAYNKVTEDIHSCMNVYTHTNIQTYMHTHTVNEKTTRNCK